MVAKIKNHEFSYTVPAGYTIDYVSEKQVKETNKELVRQRVARALIQQNTAFLRMTWSVIFRLVDAKNSILQYFIMGKSTRLRT